MSDLDTTLAALQASGLLMGIVSNAQFFTPLLFEAAFWLLNRRAWL
ncbi:hypothetical protein MASR2M78_28640 [Treponema sp.]